jgi:hypothetical protein
MNSLFEARNRWFYFLPAVHLCACLVSYIGLIIPSFQYFGILFAFILIADLPVSVFAFALRKFSVLAVIWIFVASTLWWYLLSLAGGVLLKRFLRRDSPRA